MRLHRLEVTAFGPFAGRVDVDLDRLSSAGLFLVHGPTGAGKTSLLDAVCFALYADVPGARSKRGLRSDHAAPDAVPTVRLELTVAGRRLRLERSPEFQRPKKRGEGSTKVQARVVLEERRGGSWVALSTRNDEVADLVKDVVGLGLAQFARVVLLPQGDFAAFLRATPEERREVLERLFDISVFSDVEAWLAQTRRSTGADLEEAHRALTADLARLEDALSGVAGTDQPASGPADVEPDGAVGLVGVADPEALSQVAPAAVPARLDEVAAHLTGRLTSALTDVDAAEGADHLAQQALLAATRLADARHRGAVAAARIATLGAAEPEHRERVRVLDAAGRAAGLTGHLTAVRRAEADAARSAAAVDDVVAALGRAGVEVDPSSAGDLAAAVHALDDTADVLDTATRAAADLRRRLDDVVARRDREEATADAATRSLLETAPELERLQAQAAALASAEERVPGLELALATQEGHRRTLDALDADLATADALAPRLLAARDAVLHHQQTLITLRQRRLDGMATELAAALADDAPCPVCGATEHPHPAATPADAVGVDEVEAAEVVLDASRVELARVEARATALEAAVATRREALGEATRRSVAEAVAAAAAALADAVAERRQAADVGRALDALRVRTAALTTARDGAAATTAALTEQLDTLQEQAATVADTLARALAEHEGCACGGRDARRHATVAEALDTVVRAVAGAEAGTDRVGAARADLDVAVADAGFADTDDAAAAARSADEVERLRRAVAAHDEALAAARAVLDDPEVEAALAADDPDLDAVGGAARAARQAAVAAATRHEVLARAVGVLERLRPSLDASCADVAALEARHARVRELADLTGGTGPDNTLRMRLTSFVLASRLEKVATLANERLAVMGGGRYLLEHSDERVAGGARSGLGLRVLDQWTGRTRDTSSLSGGESFMASLALALGLADAVKEESGGHDLATLFVDEGFGSLDDDSLEEVLTVLDSLREGGRAVGVVSHVADLRARVPHQVVVRKGTDGSTVEVRTGAAAPAA